VAAAPGSLLAPLATALFPAVSRAAAAGQLDTLRASVSDAVDFAYRAMIPVTAFGLVFGGDIAELLFGADYRGAGPAVSALLVGALAYALYEIFDTVLRSGGRAPLSWRIAGFALVAHVALSAVLIPRFGLAGAAWTRLLSSTLAVVAVAVPTARWLGLRPRMVTIVRPLVAAAVAFVPFALHDPGGELAELFAGGLGFVFYLIALWLLKGIRPDDIWRIQEILETLSTLQKRRDGTDSKRAR
jgi:stage V sporulation protein B